MTWPSGQPYPPRGVPQPPPMPYAAPGPYGQFPPPKKSHKGLIIGLAVAGVLLFLVVIVAVAVILFFAVKGSKAATDLKLGDCIADVPTDSRVLSVPTVDCAQPHGGEVYAVLTMTDGSYPGEAKVDEYQEKCPAELDRRATGQRSDESIGVYVLYPTQETWAHGDRAVTCIATLDPKRTGHLFGT